MKNLKLLTFLLSLFLLSKLSAISMDVEYENLNSHLKNESNTVIEVFSFTCIHCYNHHKLNTLAKVKEKIPNLEYKIYPVTQFTFGDEFAQLYAYAQAKDEKMKINFTDEKSLTHKLASLYFTAYFERNQRWNTSSEFLKLGLSFLKIDKKILDNFLNSAEGKRIYSSYNEASSIVKQYGGTPAFAVNGKYLIKMQNIKSLEHLIDTIKALSSK